MSSEIVKKVLEDFLRTDVPEVLAIRGKWGTGKTFTWDKILKSANKKNALSLKKYAYVSLFGINSLEALKLAIFEQTISRELIEEGVSLKTLNSNTDAVATSLGRKFSSILKGIPWVKDFAPFLQSASFMSISRMVICFDDFERKGNNLDSKDIMGLISLLKESKNCKVAIIFNDSSLDDASKKEYQTYREKVVDIELLFSPSTEECMSLIFPDDDEISIKLKECVANLNITNIRILKKLKKIVEDVCGYLGEYEKELRTQACHTLTLYTWCYYSKGDDIPEYTYVKDMGNILLGLDDKKDLTDKEKLWNSTLRNYGYRNTDEFDLMLAIIVENGFIVEKDLHDIANKLNEKILEGKGGNSFREAWNLYYDSFDNNEEKLIKNLNEKARVNARYVSPSDLNATVKLFRELGENNLADELVEFYINQNKDRVKLFDLDSYSFRGDIDDPQILKRFEVVFIKLKEIRTLKDVLEKIVERNGWNPEDEIILSEVTPEEYYDFFKSESGVRLPLYVEAALRFGRFDNSSERQKQIESNATEALKKIAAESRLNARRVQRFGIKLEKET